MDIFDYFRNILFSNINDIYQNTLVKNDVKIEFPKNIKYGDLSSNVAIIIAKKLKVNPKNIAKRLLSVLIGNQYVSEVLIEGVGFLNFKVKKEFWVMFLKKMLREGSEYPEINIGNGDKINIEFVSANPTGPLHLGHVKGAVFGDVIANLFLKCGFKVTREFYINDAGNQINDLANSLDIRLKQLYGEKKELDNNCYPGVYLVALAKVLKNQYGDVIRNLHSSERKEFLKSFAVKEILKNIKKDLNNLKVNHDHFVSEKSFIEQNKIDYCINFLKKKNLLYKGVLEKPKGNNKYCWKLNKHTLFKSTNFGDDIDRVITKYNGEYTYFALEN